MIINYLRENAEESITFSCKQHNPITRFPQQLFFADFRIGSLLVLNSLRISELIGADGQKNSFRPVFRTEALKNSGLRSLPEMAEWQKGRNLAERPKRLKRPKGRMAETWPKSQKIAETWPKTGRKAEIWLKRPKRPKSLPWRRDFGRPPALTNCLNFDTKYHYIERVISSIPQTSLLQKPSNLLRKPKRSGPENYYN